MIKTVWTREELTRTIDGEECLLCGGAGKTLATIKHGSDCPMVDLAIVNVTITPRSGIIRFTEHEHYRWSWWSASGLKYHAEVMGLSTCWFKTASITVPCILRRILLRCERG